jgi:transcriptional regulator with XRE-family HTH domain
MKASSRVARESAQVLGQAIRVARIDRRWTLADLAERAGVTRQTMSKVERGEPSVALGTYFEAAWLVGVPLFESDEARSRYAAHQRVELALLPSTARRRRDSVIDF